MYETLKYEVKDGIAYITVCRPEALNALNSKVIAELYDAFAEFDADADARVAILTGDGRSFVAGADIGEMAGFNTLEAREFAKAGHRTMNFIENVSKLSAADANCPWHATSESLPRRPSSDSLKSVWDSYLDLAELRDCQDW